MMNHILLRFLDIHLYLFYCLSQLTFYLLTKGNKSKEGLLGRFIFISSPVLFSLSLQPTSPWHPPVNPSNSPSPSLFPPSHGREKQRCPAWPPPAASLPPPLIASLSPR